MTAQQIKQELFALSEVQKREFLPCFFKTGEGQYGYGDKFIGVVVPKIREAVRKSDSDNYRNSLPEIEKLLNDEYHECRMAALFFLVKNFKKAKNNPTQQKEIYDFYIANYQRINNWDLVDLSAPSIVGEYLLDKNADILHQYAKSESLWLQRISIMATFSFIKKNRFEPTFEIAKILLIHPHDLIHKAVGWMLREVGKRNYDAELRFLLENDRYKTMPRTMLRYAIEKFDESIRQDFLKGRI
ncbi:MAG: DNA alkylation repair protein [Prevotellaceae bacterium]|jgi:3-methyladenine DNA glycosylase AlkD|nr:DNA alkylation repair protein [Prevotellaceae bacterium]